MPDLITPVHIPESALRIDYSTQIFFMGSCFAEHIGERMQELKFRICLNPFGVVYNPVSMADNLQQLLEKDAYTDADVSFFNELWFSYSHYTLFSDPDRQVCLDKINERFHVAKEFIRKADILSMTLGTSWVYRLKETGKFVSNCHKIPSAWFDRVFSTTDQTVQRLSQTIFSLRQINPGLKIILTVSPVRHWKDGAVENQRSKAALLLAVAGIQKDIDNVFYFPAYEIMMDELRDYRFYASDRFHPSEEAQQYIWGRFMVTYLTNEARDLVKNVEKILQSIKHKPRFPNTKSYAQFIEKLSRSAADLKMKNAMLDFSDQIEQQKSLINNPNH